jgi:TolA-binding protein
VAEPVAAVVPVAEVPEVVEAADEEQAAEETTEALGMELEELESWLEEQFGALREEIHSLRESLLRLQESSILDRQMVAAMPAQLETLTARIAEIYQSVSQWEAVEQLEAEIAETLPIAEPAAKPETKEEATSETTKEGNRSTDTKATEPPASESGPVETVAVRKRRLRAI